MAAPLCSPRSLPSGGDPRRPKAVGGFAGRLRWATHGRLDDDNSSVLCDSVFVSSFVGRSIVITLACFLSGCSVSSTPPPQGDAAGAQGDGDSAERACAVVLGIAQFEERSQHGAVHQCGVVMRTGSPLCNPGRNATSCPEIYVDTFCSCEPGEACVPSGDMCTCAATCETDEDCEVGFACLCANAEYESQSPTNRCVPAECRGADDCDGRPCVLNRACCFTQLGFICADERAECTTDADCPELPTGRRMCRSEGGGLHCLEICDC